MSTKNIPLTVEQFCTFSAGAEQVAAIKAMIVRHNERQRELTLIEKGRRSRGQGLPSVSVVPGAFGRDMPRMLTARKKARKP